MVFLLSSENISDYLITHKLLDDSHEEIITIEQIKAKNFNLLITFKDNNKFLVKQEMRDCEGKANGDLLKEWLVQQAVQKFPQLNQLSNLIPELIWFDRENSILIFRYLDNFLDLYRLYTEAISFPVKVARELGKNIAVFHRDSYDSENYQEFLVNNDLNQAVHPVHSLIRCWERIEPEIFGEIPAQGLRFFALYQKYDSLGIAIAELGNAFKPSCLTHNDLKLNNILANLDWERCDGDILRIIDWERLNWGDPAFDLGTLVSSYLQIWLTSLVVSQALSIQESLSSATIPLEKLQPSTAALIQAYFKTFPDILEYRPDFLERTIQFAGFNLIQQIYAVIQFQKCFDNTEIAMLQVAKSLLCRPKNSIPTIFGTNANEFI